MLILFAAVAVVMVTAACDGGAGSGAAIEPGGTAPPATRTPIADPAVTGTATGTTTLPSASLSPSAGGVDGTVAAEGFGGTEPVTVKSNPSPLPPRGNVLLRDVRMGVHAEAGGWDRIVFEFEENLPSGSIAYVPSASACGSGMPATVEGDAILLVRFDQAAAHTEAGQPTVARREIPGPGDTILEARQVCDFEGVVEWAIGVKGRQRFKVTQLDGPRRVVIDVKQ
jgi:hypothetical protein